MPYPWGDVDAQEWGCSVPLPAGWGPVLDAAAASEGGHGRRQDDEEPGVTPEELTVPVVLEQGPKAVQVRRWGCCNMVLVPAKVQQAGVKGTSCCAVHGKGPSLCMLFWLAGCMCNGCISCRLNTTSNIEYRPC